MNTDIDFDRLVDGELSEEERRRLLTSLDKEPGGWRRCALAFLEAQCWNDSFAGWADKIKADATKQPESPAAQPTAAYAKKRSPWAGHLGTVLSVAASFFVALWIGSAFHDWNAQPRQGFVQKTPIGVDAVVNNANNVNNVNNVRAVTPAQPAEAKPWQLVTVSPSNEQNNRAINVPARERQQLDEQWRNTPTAIPGDVMEALARTGRQVQQRRELVPVNLQDGRQMVMPVDKVDVHYVGRTY
jgi:hypothetical protein